MDVSTVNRTLVTLNGKKKYTKIFKNLPDKKEIWFNA